MVKRRAGAEKEHKRGDRGGSYRKCCWPAVIAAALRAFEEDTEDVYPSKPAMEMVAQQRLVSNFKAVEKILAGAIQATPDPGR